LVAALVDVAAKRIGKVTRSSPSRLASTPRSASFAIAVARAEVPDVEVGASCSTAEA
jgi:hypothetical protein